MSVIVSSSRKTPGSPARTRFLNRKLLASTIIAFLAVHFFGYGHASGATPDILPVTYTVSGSTCCVTPGDVNGDATVNIADVTFLIAYIFIGASVPPCAREADIDGNGTINIADGVYLTEWIFTGGPAPIPCASSASYPGDPGIPDTVRVELVAVSANRYAVTISLTIDNPVSGGTLGFKWDTANWSYESTAFGPGLLALAFQLSTDAVVADSLGKVLIGGWDIFGITPLPAGQNQLWATMFFALKPGGVAFDTAYIVDSTFVPPAGDFMLVAPLRTGHILPQFVRSETIGTALAPIVIDSTGLSFTAVQNGALPVASTFNFSINSGSSTFHTWSVSDDASWLSEAPGSGSGFGLLSQDVTVSVESTNLSPGTYLASIIINSTNVNNSPDTLPVTYTVGSICCVTPGSANGDATVNIADITFLIARIFAGGAAPPCADEGDANGSNSVNIADVTYLIALIFAGGPAPVCGTTGV